MGLDFFPAVYSHSKQLGIRSGDVVRLKEGVDAIVTAVAHATNRQTIVFVYFPVSKTIKRHYFSDIAELLREGTLEEKQESERAFDSQEETKRPSRKRPRSALNQPTPPQSQRNTRAKDDGCHSCQTLKSENQHLVLERDSLKSKLEKKVSTLTLELQQEKKKKKKLQADLKQAQTEITKLEKKEHKNHPPTTPSFTEFRRIYDKLSNLKTAVLGLVDSTLRDIEQEHIEILFAAQKQL